MLPDQIAQVELRMRIAAVGLDVIVFSVGTFHQTACGAAAKTAR